MNNDGDGESANSRKNRSETHQRLPKTKGMKPRSKRDRKRPRPNANPLQEDDLTYRTTVRRLELDGVPISISPSSSSAAIQWVRFVEPYPHTFTSFAKKRWEGRSVLDVYATEFGAYPRSYYESAIRQGRIVVSNHRVDPTYLIKGSDTLCHTVHRHEPGVAVHSPTEPYIRVLQDTDEVLVVDKPGTLPVHPCGGYHVQSLMTMLEKHYNRKLYTIHRLDRLTSGLVIWGKTSPVAQKWGKCIMDRDCQKIYLARVIGRFPLSCPPDLLSKRINNNDVDDDKTQPGRLPSHGEWLDDGTNQRQTQQDNQPSSSSSKKKAVADIATSRKRNAHTWWLSDEKGNHHPDRWYGLEHVFESQYSVDEWLETTSDKKYNPEPEESSIPPSTKIKKKEMIWLHLACPTRIAQHKDGVCEAGSFHDLDDDEYLKTVKPAHTAFGVVSYDPKSDSTVVICRPFTGRTHQIRLHLQHLGHSIANDPNYGGDLWFNNPKGEKASKVAQERLDAASDEIINGGDDDDDNNACILPTPTVTTSTGATDVPATELEIEQAVSGSVQGPEESLDDFIRRTCVWCARCRSVGDVDRSVLEFLIRSPGIWLHALQYSFTTASNDGDGGFGIADSKNDDDAKPKFNVHTYRAPLPVWHDF